MTALQQVVVLIPAHHGGDLLPFAVRSALRQELPETVELRVVILGDGVDEVTRAYAETVAADNGPVTFLDRPKAQRHGEATRHDYLREVNDDVVVYLCEDDLLAPDHVETALRTLEGADFCYPWPVFWTSFGEFDRQVPVDLTDPVQRDYIRHRTNRISLNGVAHTMAAYRRLPHGWRPAPANKWSDWHMWHQWIDQPSLRMVATFHFSTIALARSNAARQTMSEGAKAADHSRWEQLLQATDWREQLDAMLLDAIARSAAGDVGRELRLSAATGAVTALGSQVADLGTRVAASQLARAKAVQRRDRALLEVQRLRAEIRALRAEPLDLVARVRRRVSRSRAARKRGRIPH